MAAKQAASDFPYPLQTSGVMNAWERLVCGVGLPADVVRTVHEADIFGRLQSRWIPFGFENHTGWIRQDHHRPRLGQRFPDLLHDWPADVDHVTESVEQYAEALV